MPDEIPPNFGERTTETKRGASAKTRASRSQDWAAKREARKAFAGAKRQAAKDRRSAKRDAEISRSADAPGVRTVRTVFVLVVASATAAFAIQAWMSYRFAKDVWDIPRPLCVAIIAMLDLFAVTFMVLTYLMRRASWATQIYVWIVFAMAAGAQVYAAELYGSKEEWHPTIRVFSALPAIFLALALHGLILWRNHAATSAARAPEEVSAVEKPATSKNIPNSAPNSPADVPASVPATPPTPRPRPRAAAPVVGIKPQAANHSEVADRVISNRVTAKNAAAELGVSPRAVQLWVKARRLELEAAPKTFPQLNGHAFHADGPTEVGVN